MRLAFSQQTVQKYSNIKFHENPSMRMERMERQTDGQKWRN